MSRCFNGFLKISGSFTRFQNDPADSHSISPNFVQKTFEDYEGRLWVATYYGGLNLFDPSKKEFTRMVSDPTGRTTLTGRNIVSPTASPNSIPTTTASR